MRYIEHYTKPGGHRFRRLLRHWDDRRSRSVDWATGNPVRSLSTVTFLASNFCSTTTADIFSSEAEAISRSVQKDVDILYRVDGGYRDFTIYSAVVECENCQHQFDQWTESFDKESKDILANIKCPRCGSPIASKTMKHVKTTIFDPVLQSAQFKQRSAFNGSHA